jgi:hypothetical protein
VVLKGGLLFQIWDVPVTRVTRDIDLLGRFSNDLNHVNGIIKEVCAISVADDGLSFDADSVVTSRIAEDADYEGVRAKFKGRFGKMSLAMQIDFGFSDVITPSAVSITYPSVLGQPPAKLQAYNRETAVAEKFEAMIKLGELNSRMKDFFDVWVLAQNFSFDERILAKAIQTTFTRRETDIEAEPVCFTERFAYLPDKQAQWKGFIKTNRVENAPPEFSEVVGCIREFIQPIMQTILANSDSDRQWKPTGPWSEK